MGAAADAAPARKSANGMKIKQTPGAGKRRPRTGPLPSAAQVQSLARMWLRTMG